MKLTKTKLKQIIKEELNKVLNENKDIAAVEAQMTAIWNKTKEFAKIARRRVGGEWYHFRECDAECEHQRLAYLNEEFGNAEAAGNELLAKKHTNVY